MIGVAIVFPLALCLMAMAYPVYRALCMLLDNEIGLPEFAVFIGASLGLVIGLARSWGQPMCWLYGFLLVAICVGFSALSSVHQARMSKVFVEEDLARYRRAIERDDTNWGAWSRLGDLYMRGGQLDEAVQCYQRSVEVSKGNRDERFKLERALAEKRRRDEGLVPCPRCRAEIPRATPKCTNCGEVFSLALAYKQELKEPGTLVLVKWAALVSAVLFVVTHLVPGVPRLAVALLALALTATASVYLCLFMLKHQPGSSSR